jgi:hypothetical protein
MIRVILALVAAGAAAAGPGSSDARATDPISAVAQYVEMFPTASGSAPTQSVTRADTRTEPLPAALAAQVRRQPRGEALEALATSPALGAPPATVESQQLPVAEEDDQANEADAKSNDEDEQRNSEQDRQQVRVLADPSVDDLSAAGIEAAAATPTSGSSRLRLLVVALVLVTAGSAAAAFRARRGP